MSEIRPDYIDSNWVSDKVWEFISNLDFNGYILAGNSIANMIEKIPLQGDLDFWVQKLDDYFTVFNYMHKYYDHFNLYPSMVEMIDTNEIYPRINLLYTNLDSVQLINNFDFPYCRCLWTPQTGIIYQNDCEKSIKSKQIQYINLKDIKNKRILKAINYGYKFDQLFWDQYSYLLLDVSLYKLKEITIQDLDISQFQMKEFKINITNKDFNLFFKQ